MKKFWTMLLVLAMVFSLVACGGGGNTNAPADGGSSTGGSDAGNDGGSTGGSDALRMCLVVGNLGDQSFNDAAYAGCVRAEKELGADVTVMEYGADKSALPSYLLRAMDQDFDMIIVGNDNDYMGNTTVEENAGDYPDTFFLIYDVAEIDFSSAHDNVLGVMFGANESDFMAGALGSYMTQTGVIGWMGGAKIKALDDFLIGYVEGCQYANPENKVSYVFIDKGADSWGDPVTGKALSMNLYTDDHADFIHGVAGGSGNGVFDAVLDIRAAGDQSVWGIGVDSDQYQIYIDANDEAKANTIITSALKVVGAPIFYEASLLVEGKPHDTGLMIGGIKDGSGGIAKNDYYKANVPADVQASIEKLEADIISGAVVSHSIYLTSDADYAAILASGTTNKA